jgi:arylsulfatase A-like enzyme
MTDQQNARMLSCAGNPHVNTPALDGLAREGIRFNHAYCANPVCVPSRTSMATGVMSCRLGASTNITGLAVNDLPPEVNANSMGKIMKRAGYDTFYGGKVHMCPSLVPENAGYDEFFPDRRALLPTACLAFMNKKRDKPFFAVASFINPHDICDSRTVRSTHSGLVLKLYERAVSLPLDKLPPLPDNYAIQQGEPAGVERYSKATAMRNEFDAKEWRINRWIYHRLVESVDKQIGIILAGLKKAGLEENTLVVFTSDHGEMDASHRLGLKGICYEESVGVPLILKYKGMIPSGKIDKTHLISTGLDILPTLCHYAGVRKPAHLLGRSLAPLAEKRAGVEWRNFVCSENNWFRMIRTHRYKYCAFSAEDGKESLVDMENDPGELRNVVDDPSFTDILDAHRNLLADWITRSDDKEGADKYLWAS